MKLTYDPNFNFAYIRLYGEEDEVETLNLSDEINFDLTPDGKIYGIELLNANEQLWKHDKGKVIVEGLGVVQEIVAKQG